MAERRGGGHLNELDLARRIVEIAQDRQASDIVLLDIRPVTIVADFFVICSGTSDRHLTTLTRTITDTIKQESGRGPRRLEGTAASGWVLVDYGDVVVHLFSQEQREYYQLEDVWTGSVPMVRIQ